MSLHHLLQEPDLDRPVLLVALDSFGDAGSVQASTLDVIRGQLEFETIASFDTDALLDYRIRRPTLKVHDGMIDRVSWPTIELTHAVDAEGTDVLLLHGHEPDRRWHEFVEEVIDLALRFNVRLMVGLGSFPGPVPHTIPTQLATTATDESLASQVPYLPDELEVPSSIQAVLEWEAAQHEITSVGLWAPVPQYAAMQPYPAAAAALLRRINEITGLRIDTKTLQDAGEVARRRIDAAVAESPEHRRLVEALERHVESMKEARATELPSGDELAAQLQQFLDDSD